MLGKFSVFKSNTDEIYRNIFLKKRDIVSIVPAAHRKHCIKQHKISVGTLHTKSFLSLAIMPD